MVFNENDESIFNQQEAKDSRSQTTISKDFNEKAEDRDSMISFSKEYRNNRFTVEQQYPDDSQIATLSENQYYNQNKNLSKSKKKSKRRSRDERNSK